jgi:general secretion pathway protein B
VHVYDRSAAQRFVRVNGRRYREGETLAEGPLLVAIARDGLVLEYRGQRLLYPL